LSERVVRLEHAGSTSVPGLAAKPIIDIVLEVPDAAEEAAYLPAMEAAGYVLRLREPNWFQHRLLKGPDPDTGSCMSAPNGSWPPGRGRRCSSTPTPRPRSFVRSWLAPRAAIPCRRATPCTSAHRPRHEAPATGSQSPSSPGAFGTSCGPSREPVSGSLLGSLASGSPAAW
jgi:hypothetical protein